MQKQAVNVVDWVRWTKRVDWMQGRREWKLPHAMRGSAGAVHWWW